MTDDYTPTEDEIVMGKIHLGDNFWRELSEAEVRRGIAQVRAETLREFAKLIHPFAGRPSAAVVTRSGVYDHAHSEADRIEKEAGL